MLTYDRLSPDVFLERLEQLLSNPSAKLVTEARQLVGELQPSQLTAAIERRIGEAPSLVKHAATLMTLPAGGAAVGLRILPSAWTAGLAAATLTHTHARVKHGRRHNSLVSLMAVLTLERASLGLSEKEKGLIRAYGVLFAEGAVSPADWDRFAARMVWADGKCTISAPKQHQNAAELTEARLTLADILKSQLDGHEAFLAQSASRVASVADGSPGRLSQITKMLSPGARWMTGADIAASQVLTFDKTPASLIIGTDRESGRPVYFNRNESLFTIGGPGTGKTECQVIPNLLSYPGSALVLDVKGELWEKTAGYRARHFGPVYRFAPTDPDGRSHRYNPFDFIAASPEQSATDCEVFSFQVVTPTPGHHDPYWENRGRDFLWALAMVVALQANKHNRAMATLMRLLSVPLDVKPSDQSFPGSDTDRLIKGLSELAARHKVPALAEHANAIRGGLGSQRLESVADNARRFLNIFSRSATLRAAMSASDWTPRQLRERPGTTVYLCLSGDDLDTFAPIVRLILQQHANALLRDFTAKPGTPPITFFLDEFPQLKHMGSIMRMVDTGRGAGLRLWFFAQYLGQVRQAYDKQADGLIGACRVRSFLSPDAEAAEFLRPYLGTTTNLFSGEKRPLAEPHELVGAEFQDTILTMAGGPHRFEKKFAWQTLGSRILPPPAVPALKLNP